MYDNIKPCTIRDLPVLMELCEEYFQRDCTEWLRGKLYSKEHHLFLFKEELIVSFELISPYKYCIHIIGTSKGTKELRDYFLQIGSWVFDNTEATCLLVFASNSNKRLQRFVAITGGKRIGIVKEGDKDIDEVLYSYSKTDKEHLIRGLKWQQH